MTSPGESWLKKRWKTTTMGVLWLHMHLNSSSICFCSWTGVFMRQTIGCCETGMSCTVL